MRTLHVNQDEMFSVEYEAATGAYFLDVVAGGAGLYTRRIQLKEDEVIEYKDNPRRLVSLADRVRKWPERFAERLKTL
jgi:hypothetical protein